MYAQVPQFGTLDTGFSWVSQAYIKSVRSAAGIAGACLVLFGNTPARIGFYPVLIRFGRKTQTGRLKTFSDGLP
ncbi:hypothetical protein [Neisseria musculi]|uniref:hypothetical protein n=1 Tax=Neisseria musculi TaxID=1815583 RepID=UPI00164B16C3|nr:hypothetical protein [Neisseria musculi]